MTDLCSVDDVRRVGGITADPPTDETLDASRASIESWFKFVSGRTYEEDGTDVFFNGRLDDIFKLSATDAVPSEVRIWTLPELDPWTFTDDTNWQVTNAGLQLFLFAPLFQAMQQGTAGWSLRDRYARVEVDWDSEAVVPEAVRDGIALLAASLYKQGKTSTSQNVKSERIGDYSYTLDAGTSTSQATVEALNPIGFSLIKPFLRGSKQRVIVV